MKNVIDVAQQLLIKNHWLLKCIAVAALGGFALSGLESLRTNSDHSLSTILLIVNESITIFLIVIAKKPKTLNLSPLPVIFAIVGTMHFLFIQFNAGVTLIPVLLGQFLMLFGLIFQVVAKLSLGRSFGIVPANRGVKQSGLYKLVRHPIYLGYFIVHVGFLLQNFSARNVAVYAVLYAFQIGRIFFEERELSKDIAYQEFMKKTRWRLIPFIF
jgi:protein-S-isoprenylcysteine O-methyltransferase Ste14